MTIPKIRHIPLFPDEFLAAVAGEMSPAELGVYWMVCLLCYSRGGDINLDLNWLRAKFRPGKGNRVVGEVLDALIKSGRVARDGPQIGVRRVRDELERALRRVREASENGHRGGRGNKKNNDLDDTNPLETEKLTNNYKLETITVEANASPVSVRAETRGEQFERWWKAYPHRVGKGAAKAKFDIALREKGVTVAELIAGVARYVATKPPERNWCNPASWLFQERWKDEPDTGQASSNGHAVEPRETEEEIWRARLNACRGKKHWPTALWGPPPGHPQCGVPPPMMPEFVAVFEDSARNLNPPTTTNGSAANG